MFEGKTEYLDILLELFLEIYGQFEEEEIPKEEQIKEIIYWYASDYCDVFVADRIREQIDGLFLCAEYHLQQRSFGSSVSLPVRGIYQRKREKNGRTSAGAFGRCDL